MICSIPGVLLTADSIMPVILESTISAFAPGNVVVTEIIGKSRCGYIFNAVFIRLTYLIFIVGNAVCDNV